MDVRFDDITLQVIPSTLTDTLVKSSLKPEPEIVIFLLVTAPLLEVELIDGNTTKE